jgi:hypothetical protein
MREFWEVFGGHLMKELLGLSLEAIGIPPTG